MMDLFDVPGEKRGGGKKFTTQRQKSRYYKWVGIKKKRGPGEGLLCPGHGAHVTLADRRKRRKRDQQRR